jgi:membrane-associated HD superfamily phosphohydrolase
MEFYTWACEAFERETYDIYRISGDARFMATEGAGTWVADKVKAGWARVVEIAKKVWTWFKDAVRSIPTIISKLFAKIKGLPEEIHLKREYASWVKEVTQKLKTATELSKEIDDVTKQLLDGISRTTEHGKNATPESAEKIENYLKKCKWITEQYTKLIADEINENVAADKKRMGMDSFLSAIAMEADGDNDASEQQKGIKIRLTELKPLIVNLGKRTAESTKKNEQCMAKVTTELEKVAKEATSAAPAGDATGDASETGEGAEAAASKQRLWSKVVNAFSVLGGILMKIPKWLASLPGKIFARREKPTGTTGDAED